jgi:predicted GNAT superfamily acetyltransferase
MPITIRPVAALAEYDACERLQLAVWGGGVVPNHLLLTMQKNGGVVLGAFDEGQADAPLVGFVFGFLARTPDGRLKHASHMAAVLPAYRDHGLGERLKWAQRAQVLNQGVQLMTWTFDPLISRNARLNLHKLGGIARSYLPNHYGPEPEDPNGELPSDRFLIEWHLASPRVLARLPDAAALGVPDRLDQSIPLANPDPLGSISQPAANRFHIQIPADIEALKATDMPKARAWRFQVRALAQAAFAAGYTITDYRRQGEVGFYLVEHSAHL